MKEKIHINSFLTQNILLDFGDGFPETNMFGEYWKLIAEVVKTSKAPDEEFERFVGRIRIDSKHFTLEDAIQKIEDKTGLQLIEEQVKKIASENTNWTPINAMPRVIRL